MNTQFSSIFYESSSMQILNEIYFGDNYPELQKALKILGEYRSKYIGLDQNYFIKDANSDTLLDDFGKCLARFFGFKNVILIVKGDLLPNAYTYPINLSYSGREAKVTKTKHGYMYDGSISLYTCLYSSIVFNELFTDREVMAILLHEIGHNFSSKYSHIVSVKNLLYTITIPILLLIGIKFQSIGILKQVATIAIMSSEAGKLALNKIYKNKLLSPIVSIGSSIIKLKDNINTYLSSSIPGIGFLSAVYSISHFNEINYVIGSVDENIADNFATIYGFGPDLNTGLEKLNNKDSTIIRKALYNTPVIGWFTELLYISGSWASSVFDEHPTTASRRRAQYNYLLNELENEGISKSMKKEIQECINLMEEDFKKSEKILKPYNGSLISATYNKLINHMKSGGDPRQAIIIATNRDSNFDTVYNKGPIEDYTINGMRSMANEINDKLDEIHNKYLVKGNAKLECGLMDYDLI